MKRVRYKRVLLLLFVVFLISYSIYYFLNLKITNIYVTGDSLLDEQYVLELALIDDYPKTLFNSSNKIEDNLKESQLIIDATVTKKWFSKVYIEIEENYPLFYYEYDETTILKDGTSTPYIYSVPTVLNYVTDKCYQELIVELGKLDKDILSRINEIEFVPDEIDDSRFYLSMSDGNYVYININTFEKMNLYISIMTKLPKENGILYLDYGNNFEILD